MRETYQKIFKQHFYKNLIETRTKQNLTQAKMAEQLVMDARSYINLDHGKSGCSSLTLALFLIYCCENPIEYLKELREAFEKDENHITSQRLIYQHDEAISYRTPLAVTEYIMIKSEGMYPVCPRCKISFEREYTNFCINCGQKLDWKDFPSATERKDRA